MGIDADRLFRIARLWFFGDFYGDGNGNRVGD